MSTKKFLGQSDRGFLLFSVSGEDFLVQRSQSVGPENGASQSIQRLCRIFEPGTN